MIASSSSPYLRRLLFFVDSSELQALHRFASPSFVAAFGENNAAFFLFLQR
jgi:hypothetical protein